MKVLLMVWLLINDLPPDKVSGYEFKSQEGCINYAENLRAGNPNIGALCISLEEWRNLENG